MIGKRVGVFPDVRLARARNYGKKSHDPGGLDFKSVQLFLSITGEDTLALGRKNRTAWQGKLPIKLTLISNVILNMNDRVEPSRCIKCGFGVSFAGREDVELGDRLLGELPGIAARAAAAYRRLIAIGRDNRSGPLVFGSAFGGPSGPSGLRWSRSGRP